MSIFWSYFDMWISLCTGLNAITPIVMKIWTIDSQFGEILWSFVGRALLEKI